MAGKDQARELHQPGGDRGIYALAALFGTGVGAAVIVQVSALIAGAVDGREVETSINPILILLNLATGKMSWGLLESGIAAALLAVVVLVVCLVLRGRSRKTKDAKRGDFVTKHLASKKDIDTLGRKTVTKAAERLVGPEMAKEYPGLRIGHEVSTKQGLYAGWEDLHLILAGPRIGKTTASVIPAIVEAPGAVVTTSNKSDIVYDTYELTHRRGSVYIFDPQGIAANVDQDPWFYDPLSYIRADVENMDAAAGALASLFASPYLRDESGDNYFPNAAKNLLTGMLLAAALERRPISDVLLWANNEKDPAPQNILANYPQWDFWRKTLQSQYQLTEKTRSGVFGQAQNMVAMLSRSEVRRWVDPRPGAVEFNPHDFVRQGRPTLYLLSKEGPRSVGMLTTILTVAVMEAAEDYGIECGGRLPVPMVCPLDEAANTVLWKDLPSMYSHYGSRGIILMTYLQSYSQGIGVWGKEKMEALWSAATILCVGGGIRDAELLHKLSEQIGQHEEYQRSASSAAGSPTSVSRSVREKTTLTASEISELPKGRWIVRSVGRRTMLAATEPFWERDWDKETMLMLENKQEEKA
ncbi:type IV secretory system conjugative DNA transfer family protein [Corynebacterium sp. A21]|uniref:type IV secretory system conjugative DNA transfer family protein n=1 Tax=Corynebacterium sp. A21 TaxID=3457318 RepID=UPI003FD11660